MVLKRDRPKYELYIRDDKIKNALNYNYLGNILAYVRKSGTKTQRLLAIAKSAFQKLLKNIIKQPPKKSRRFREIGAEN